MSIIGHAEIIADLKKLAEGGRLRHSYLFWGENRVGKRTAALAFARYLERKSWEVAAEDGASPLLDCLSVGADDDAAIGIDRIRAIRHFLSQKPNASPRRTIIIDRGEQMTAEAQNALLKIAEDPPRSALVILIAKDPEALLPTLASRFHKLFFGTVPQKEIERWLMREEKLTEGKAKEFARRSLGEPGRAWALMRDPAYARLEEEARAFLKLHGSSARNAIKELATRDDFALKSFLDAIIAELIFEKRYSAWHRVLALRHEAQYFNVNPRLQLENLIAGNF